MPSQEQFNRLVLRIMSKYDVRYTNPENEDVDIINNRTSLEITNSDCWVIDFYYTDMDYQTSVVLNKKYFMKIINSKFRMTDDEIFQYMKNIINDLFNLDINIRT
jgi:hypothetical protein